jgi:hypothetical protein
MEVGSVLHVTCMHPTVLQPKKGTENNLFVETCTTSFHQIIMLIKAEIHGNLYALKVTISILVLWINGRRRSVE